MPHAHKSGVRPNKNPIRMNAGHMGRMVICMPRFYLGAGSDAILTAS